MENFEKRQKDFQDKLIKLSEEYSIDLYAANVVLKNGEVMPAIKLADLAETKNADTTSKQSSFDKEA